MSGDKEYKKKKKYFDESILLSIYFFGIVEKKN